MSSTKFNNLDLILTRLRIVIGDRTQKEFAEWIDESPSTVTEWMRGRSKPGWDALKKLADKGVNINWLLTGNGDVYTSAEKQSETIKSIPSLLDMKHLTDQFIGKVAETVAEYKEKAKELEERKKAKK